MRVVNAKLSARGLETLAAVYSGDQFRFVVGEQTYECPFFIAAFLSPRVAQARVIDETSDEFVVDTKDPNHEFAQFLSLGRGFEISIEPGSFPFFASVAGELGNEELLKTIWCQIGDELNWEVCMSRYLFSREPKCWDAAGLEFVASHFHEISAADFGRLDIDSLRQILSHSSLKILSEGHLFDLISSCFDSSNGYFGLLEYVRFDFLSVECIGRFVELGCDHFEL
jgi:hypothetical protein